MHAVSTREAAARGALNTQLPRSANSEPGVEFRAKEFRTGTSKLIPPQPYVHTRSTKSEQRRCGNTVFRVAADSPCAAGRNDK
jgi:hypothetical protein